MFLAFTRFKTLEQAERYLASMGFKRHSYRQWFIELKSCRGMGAVIYWNNGGEEISTWKLDGSDGKTVIHV